MSSARVARFLDPSRVELSGVRRDVVIPVRVDPAGVRGPTPKQARGPNWRRTSSGLYVPSQVDSTKSDQRIVEAAAAIPDTGAVTGWASLHWRGARWFDGLAGDGKTRRPVPVWIGHDRRIRPFEGAALTEEFLEAEDLECVDGLRVTTPVRAVFHEVRKARTPRQAGIAIDMAAADDCVSIDELARYASRRLAGVSGVVRLTGLLDSADENCWSPTEYSMRTTWTLDGQFPRPLCNPPIFGMDGTHLLTPDLFDPVSGVAGEYDGAGHLQLAQRGKDVVREECYRALGIERVIMLSPDLRDPSGFLRRLESAYRRAGQRVGPCGWTLDQPDWWVDTSTVERRRELTAEERRIWLRRLAG